MQALLLAILRADVPAAAVHAVDPRHLALAGVCFLLVGIALLPVARFLFGRIAPQPDGVIASWSARHVAAVAVWVFGGVVATSIVVSFAGSDVQLALVCSAIVFGSASVLVGAIALLSGGGLRALGVRATGSVRAVFAGLVAYVLLLPALLGVGLLWNVFLEWSGVGGGPQPIAEELSNLGPGERLIPIVIGAVLMPLFEETLFRAFLQPVFVRRLGGIAGVVVTSLIFAGLHGVEAFVPILVLSCLLGTIMLRTQRLAACFAVHALHNSLQFVLMYALPHLRHLAP